MAPDPRGHPDSTRQALLEAARVHFGRDGYEATSVRRITSEAGVNLGAVTYHFGSKHALHEEVLARSLGPLREGVEEAVQGSPAREALEGAVAAITALARKDPNVARLVFREIAAEGAPPEPVSAALGEVVDRLADLVRDGKAQGDVEAGDPVLTAVSLLVQALGSPLMHGALAAGRGGGLRGRGEAEMDAHLSRFVDRALSP